MLLDGARGMVEVHVAQRGDVDPAAAEHVRDVAAALPTDADAAEIQHFARWSEAWSANDMARDDLKTEGGSRG